MPKRKTTKKVAVKQRSLKEEKLFNNLLRITEQFMAGKGFSPLSQDELMQRLGLPLQHESIFHDVLTALEKAEMIHEDRGRFVWKQAKNNVISGVMRMHSRGFGFVQPDDPSLCAQDIFIPKHLTKNAIDGDTVEVLINTDSTSDKGPEGKVLAILTRARTHMAGIIRATQRDGTFLAYVPLLGQQQRVFVEPSDEHPLKVGDRIVMAVVDWGTKELGTVCRFSHYLGHISDPSCDISAAIEEFDLRSDFPQKAIDEAEKYGKAVPRNEIARREDLREQEIVTIDPDTAKDFDDAISLTKDKKGHYHLGVHIADVSHYVKPGTALDEEASVRCNSTYFPRQCIPMLPGALSENLCSLKPNVCRLTVSVFATFDSNGDLLTHRIARTVIKSAKRFTYKEAKKVLDGEKESPHSPLLHRMVELCRLLKKKRYERGSIEFSLPELVVMVDENGTPTGTDYIAYDVTHQMIEEFMLKANELVALDLFAQGKELTYRVHDTPAEENLRDFAQIAAAFGFKVPDYPTPQDIQALFEEAAATPYGSYLASSYIRRMRLAAYSAENIGHYGLSLTHYCHFTSPIRRYVDLVVHRLLFAEGEDFNYIQSVANRCSDQERVSAKAEGAVVLLKKLRLLDRMNKEDPHREYSAIITKVKNFGITFEVVDLMLEGFIHISEVGDDYYIFEEKNMRLRGRNKGETFAAGDKLSVMLQSVDFISQEAKWTSVAGSHKAATPHAEAARKTASPKKEKRPRKQEKKQRADKNQPKTVDKKKQKSTKRRKRK